ncbi:GNAT family N-acetyltransferase [Modestobacter sp. L9-4]|uniref:GNAT family N-acetyltransferase n=1 Tax=Modestobacter sp. L9-4 TaxID=2851567 RepID=UPI001C788DFF|nr:GNAT family N-acetyltransferase [Modestobacter sp. L9-4]QXG75747.1 GNAT family N-acetyltransferase [Modestobacter sp. L9-4]
MADTLRGALPTELTDGRADLRLMTPGDWPVEVALSAVPDVVRWTRYPPDLDETGARARIETRTRGAAAGTGGRYVVRDPTGLVAGTAGIAMNGQRDPEVFYALLPAGRGRGLATAATRQLTRWALDVGHDRVVLKTILGNTASEAVARRSGFTPAGVETATVRDAEVQLRRWQHLSGTAVP